jgi:hypothetical protein
MFPIFHLRVRLVKWRCRNIDIAIHDPVAGWRALDEFPKKCAAFFGGPEPKEHVTHGP